MIKITRWKKWQQVFLRENKWKTNIQNSRFHGMETILVCRRKKYVEKNMKKKTHTNTQGTHNNTRREKERQKIKDGSINQKEKSSIARFCVRACVRMSVNFLRFHRLLKNGRKPKTANTFCIYEEETTKKFDLLNVLKHHQNDTPSLWSMKMLVFPLFFRSIFHLHKICEQIFTQKTQFLKVVGVVANKHTYLWFFIFFRYSYMNGNRKAQIVFRNVINIIRFPEMKEQN